MRTIIDLPEDLAQALDAMGRERGASRAALVREAVRDYLDRNRRDPREAFGLWRDRTEEAIDYQERLRDEWNV
ncbi:MAG TPA: ribbon-helix-helix protein, CopG family [Trueperaceae bacterium]|nr:ribbon-helix-helix protein, CopG family [Trueperaceae bacterium]